MVLGMRLYMASTLLLGSICSTAWAVSPAQLVQDARKQIGVTVSYDPAYTRLDYPMGDVPASKGVCTDVVIRALRLQGIDLQKQVHEDMRKAFAIYPKKWGLSRPDSNIDHRRVPNLMRYFQRKGYAVDDQRYLPGDIVAWDLNGKGLTHIGIVSDKQQLISKTPLIIHNIGAGTQENNILYQYKIIGHYRIP
jgi:uncharacterized protein YijF (DUF1287 family)